MTVKVGALVKYIPSPSSTFKWQDVATHTRNPRPAPGIVLREIDSKGTTTRRFEIRWNDGEVSEEWISYLEVYE